MTTQVAAAGAFKISSGRVGVMKKRPTLQDMAAVLRAANPENQPMYLRWMAEQWWPGADWLRSAVHIHSGGAKRGVRVAGAFAGRLERLGLLRMCGERGPRSFHWVALESVESSVTPAADCHG